MKKRGIFNAQLSRIVASMGHMDRLVIGDSGLPVPENCEKVDLALASGIPQFEDTLRTVLEELEVEAAIVAEEITDQNAPVFEAIKRSLPGIELKFVSHETFKRMMHEDETVACVRTGEVTPYANIILVAGVTF